MVGPKVGTLFVVHQLNYNRCITLFFLIWCISDGHRIQVSRNSRGIVHGSTRIAVRGHTHSLAVTHGLITGLAGSFRARAPLWLR